MQLTYRQTAVMSDASLKLKRRRAYPDGTGLKLVSSLNSAVDILAEYSSSETVDWPGASVISFYSGLRRTSIVGLFDDVVIILELDDDANGAEDLLLDDSHVGFRLREDGRGDEVPFAAYALASKVDLGTVGLPRIDVPHDALHGEQVSVRKISFQERNLRRIGSARPADPGQSPHQMDLQHGWTGLLLSIS